MLNKTWLKRNSLHSSLSVSWLDVMGSASPCSWCPLWSGLTIVVWALNCEQTQIQAPLCCSCQYFITATGKETKSYIQTMVRENKSWRNKAIERYWEVAVAAREVVSRNFPEQLWNHAVEPGRWEKASEGSTVTLLPALKVSKDF